jgi:DNA polymerase I
MFADFREVVLADFEFEARPGDRPVPVCMVAHELRSGRRFRIWQDQFGPVPPFATGPDVLFLAYYVSAELGCYRALGWPMPARILDLFVEFRNRTNGLPTPAGSGLLGALTYFGLDGIGAEEKDEIRKAIGNGTWRGRYAPDEILDYCESDVLALGRLLPAMLPGIDFPRAICRGRYMAAAAVIEFAGVPIDVPTLELLRANWTRIQDRLIAEIDADSYLMAAPSRRTASRPGWSPTTYRGHDSKADIWRSMTTPSDKWPAPTHRYRHCESCEARCRSYG